MKNFGSFDWSEFMKSFTPSPNGKSTFEMDFSQMEDFIQKSMNEVLPSNLAAQSPGTTSKQDVFETHDYMIIKIPVPEHIDVNEVSVFFDTNVLMVTGISKEKERITLPMNGNFTGSQGYYKNGMIEIRIPKNEKKNFKEIMIKHL